MVRGKTVPVRALTDNLDHKITSFSIFTPSNHERVIPKTDQANTALRNSTSNPATINPHLSEIQQHIIDAIKKFEGSCKFEDIFQFVSQKWTGGKQRNTSSECRKSIQQVLNSMVCLFQKDHNTKEWTFCTTFNPNHQGGINSDQSFFSGDTADDLSIKQETSMDLEEMQLTDLQQLIAQTIVDHKGACHFDILHHQVLENWKGLRGRDGQPKVTDCKRAILASLSKNIRTQPLFKRANSTKYWWQLGEYNPFYTKELDHEATLIEMIDEPIFKNTKSVEIGIPAKTSKDDLRLTDLQIFVIEAIAESGGTASIDQITDRVSKNWGRLRRRDGSKYTTDCRRAVQASLANNSSTKPIFKRESKLKGIWGLGKRAMEYLEMKGITITELEVPPPAGSRTDISPHQMVIEPDPELDGVALDESDLDQPPEPELPVNSPPEPHLHLPGSSSSSSSFHSNQNTSLDDHSMDVDDQAHLFSKEKTLPRESSGDDREDVERSTTILPGGSEKKSPPSPPSLSKLKTRPEGTAGPLSPCHSTSSDDSVCSPSDHTPGKKSPSLRSTSSSLKGHRVDQQSSSLSTPTNKQKSTPTTTVHNKKQLKKQPKLNNDRSSKHASEDQIIPIHLRDHSGDHSITSSSIIARSSFKVDSEDTSTSNPKTTLPPDSKPNCKSESSESSSEDSGQRIFDDIFGNLSSADGEDASNDGGHSGDSSSSNDESDDHSNRDPDDDILMSSSGTDQSEPPFEDESSDTEDDDSQDDEFQNDSDDSSSDLESALKKSSLLTTADRKSSSRDASSSSDDRMSEMNDSSSSNDGQDSENPLDGHEPSNHDPHDHTDPSDAHSNSSENDRAPPQNRRGRKKKSALPPKKNRIASVGGSHLGGGGPNSPSLIQTLIKDSIVNNNGSCSLDLIIKEVLSGISELPSVQKKSLQNGFGSLSALIESTLSSKVSSAQFFRQDARNPDIWMLSRRGSRAWPIDSGDTLTDLQAEIVQIMALNGGKASWDTIVNEIAMLNFTRKSGAGKARKIIKASLNANINDRPIFKRDKSDNWMVADKKIQERVLKKYDGLLSKRKNFPEENEVQPRKKR